ncbi:MAG: hypothetical protein ACYS8X_11245 [Planctomycetota bacterium]|jgi:hypothetical protein
MRKMRFLIIGFVAALIIALGLFVGRRHLRSTRIYDSARGTAIGFFEPGGPGNPWATRQVGEPVSVRVLHTGTGVDNQVAKVIMDRTSVAPADPSTFDLKRDLADTVIWVECELSGPRGMLVVKHLSLPAHRADRRISVPFCIQDGQLSEY